jgi:hypothetical protein
MLAQPQEPLPLPNRLQTQGNLSSLDANLYSPHSPQNNDQNQNHDCGPPHNGGLVKSEQQERQEQNQSSSGGGLLRNQPNKGNESNSHEKNSPQELDEVVRSILEENDAPPKATCGDNASENTSDSEKKTGIGRRLPTEEVNVEEFSSTQFRGEPTKIGYSEVGELDSSKSDNSSDGDQTMTGDDNSLLSTYGSPTAQGTTEVVARKRKRQDEGIPALLSRDQSSPRTTSIVDLTDSDGKNSSIDENEDVSDSREDTFFWESNSQLLVDYTKQNGTSKLPFEHLSLENGYQISVL